MTVQELIEKLKDLPQQAEVMVLNHTGGYTSPKPWACVAKKDSKVWIEGEC